MNNLVKESFFISHLLDFFKYLNRKFKEGYLYSLFTRISLAFNLFLANSKIWTSFFSKNKLDAFFVRSGFVKFLNKILNLPASLLRNLYTKYEKVFEASFLFKILHFLSNNYGILFGLSLTITIMIPDHKWYNVYSVFFTLALLLLFLFKSVTDREYSLDIGKLDFSYILFFIAIGLSAVLSLFPKDSLNNLIFYSLTFISVLILVSWIKTTENLNLLTDFLVFTVFLTGLYGFYQWKIVGIEVNPSLTDISVNQGMSGRVFSTMGNPNIYGELLVMIMPFFLASFLNTKSWLKKFFISGAFLTTLVILLKTGSRSAWVSFAGGIMIFIFFWNKKLLPPLIVLGIFALPFLPSSIYRRIMTIFNPQDSSLQYRKDILEPAIPMLKDYWITGVGLGIEVFNTIYKRYKSFTLKTVAHTHNLFLQVWLESGIVALISLLWLGFRLVRKTTYIVRNSKDEELKNIVIASLAGIGGLMVMGFADHVWFYNRILLIFWVLVAIIFAANNIIEKEEI